jgi:hypothetical protein
MGIVIRNAITSRMKKFRISTQASRGAEAPNIFRIPISLMRP